MFIRLWPSDKLLYIPIDLSRFERLQAFTTVKRASCPDEKKPNKMLSPKSLAGPGYIILNGIRVANITGLLAVIAASVVMLVKTSVASKFFFFDAVSHVLTAVTGMFLLTSELSLFRPYFARNWPLLSPEHGFVTLALFMIVLGINMLGNLNKEATSQDSLGLAFWRIVIASGIIIFIMGWINLIASYIFRDSTQNITARQVRAHGAVAIHKSPMPPSSMSACSRRSSSGHTPPAPILAQSYLPNPLTPISTGNRSNGKKTSAFRILTSRDRTSLLPSYHSTDKNAATPYTTTTTPLSPPYPNSTHFASAPFSPTSRYSRATACTKKKVFGFMNTMGRQSVAPPLPVNVHTTTGAGSEGGAYREPEISGPVGVNPQFAHLVRRPDSALHPARSGEGEAFRWRAVGSGK